MAPGAGTAVISTIRAIAEASRICNLTTRIDLIDRFSHVKIANSENLTVQKLDFNDNYSHLNTK